MDHVAIMKRSWGLLPKIISGEKICEARWYKSKRDPWNRVKPKDTIYFKNSAEPVSLVATVSKVFQYEIKNNNQARNIMNKHALYDLGTRQVNLDILSYINNKKYAIFVYFINVKKVKPFKIDKRGFGSMSAWISIKDIDKVRF